MAELPIAADHIQKLAAGAWVVIQMIKPALDEIPSFRAWYDARGKQFKSLMWSILILVFTLVCSLWYYKLPLDDALTVSYYVVFGAAGIHVTIGRTLEATVAKRVREEECGDEEGS